MRAIVYLIVKPTGHLDGEGVESVILIDAKLTSASADTVAARHPGAIVQKMTADKFPD